MTYIGHIVNRDTSSVEIFTAETFEDLEKQIDERYAELRQELEVDDDDDLGEDFDWDFEEVKDVVSKADYDELKKALLHFAETAFNDYVLAVDRGDLYDNASWVNDPEAWKATMKDQLETLQSVGIYGKAILDRIRFEEDVEEYEGDEDDDSEVSN